MKFHVLLLACLLPVLLLAQSTDAEKLIERNGLTYEPGSSKPFTGHATTNHKNGTKQSSASYKDGRLNGKLESWYANGIKQVEGQLINGQKAGVWTAWYENGNKIRQGGFQNGKEEGEYFWWFENGNLNKVGVYHNGIADGKWEWYYENGKKKQEGILRGETNQGTWKDWYQDGTQKMIGHFKNGLKDGEWIWWDEKGIITTRKNYKNDLVVEGRNDVDTHLENLEVALTKKDFKAALHNIEKAIATVADKTEDNKLYMGLVVYHSKVYSYFQHLDQAETILLQSTGLPDSDITEIVKTNYPPAVKEMKNLAAKILAYPQTKTRVGPHIALALLYNILGDTVKLQEEQQLMMERSNTSDWVIQTSLELYKIRSLKENTYGEIAMLREKIAKEGASKELELHLANNLLTVGQFIEAGLISDRYLLKDSKDLDFLFIKLNIEMAKGDLVKLNEYESRIRTIKPTAFDIKK